MVKTFDKYTAKYKGSSITTIDENQDGVIKFTTHSDLDGKQDTDKKLASIGGDVYKFEGDDMEYTKAGAMQFYSFSQAKEFLTEQFGNAIVPGEKKVITMDTVYGEREVTRQMFTIDALVGEIHYTAFYGDADVLYKYIVGTHTDMDEDDYFAMTVTCTLKDCTAVTTEEI